MTLMAHVAQDAVVIEVADGIFQRETAALLRSPVFAELVGGIVLAARDAMGASSAVNWLSAQSTPVLALSGLLSAAPLQCAEASLATGLPVYNREGLAMASTAMELIGRTQRKLEIQVQRECAVQTQQERVMQAQQKIVIMESTNGCNENTSS